VTAPEHVTGDILDRDSVRRALEGCDAVVHAAAVFSFDPRRGDEMMRANIEGAEHVLGTAVDLGLDPIVHVSTYGAFTDRRHVTVSPDTEPGRPRPAYLRAKAEADRVARRFQ